MRLKNISASFMEAALSLSMYFITRSSERSVNISFVSPVVILRRMSLSVDSSGKGLKLGCSIYIVFSWVK
jgi:hypothetical protein